MQKSASAAYIDLERLNMCVYGLTGSANCMIVLWSYYVHLTILMKKYCQKPMIFLYQINIWSKKNVATILKLPGSIAL